MSLNAPSYALRIVFFVLRYTGYPRWSPKRRLARAKSRMESLKLYIPIPTPPSAPKVATSNCIGSPPSDGVYVIVSVPGPFTLKSVALY